MNERLPYDRAGHELMRLHRSSDVPHIPAHWVFDQRQVDHDGFRMLPRSPSSFTPFPDGRSLLLGPDKALTHREVFKFSARDADALPRYETMLERVAEFIEPTLIQTGIASPIWAYPDTDEQGNTVERVVPKSAYARPTVATVPRYSGMSSWSGVHSR